MCRFFLLRGGSEIFSYKTRQTQHSSDWVPQRLLEGAFNQKGRLIEQMYTAYV